MFSYIQLFSYHKMDTSDVNELHLLYKKKRDLVKEIRYINNQINKLQEIVEKTCNHQLIKERSFDGHRYHINYQCFLCKTYPDNYENYPIVDERYNY